MREAVILAGGFGSRLKSVSGDTPKPMVDVAGVPFLYRLMKKLERDGFSKIILSLGYSAEYVQARVEFSKPVDCEVLYSIESEPLGTGGAIKKAASLIEGQKFVVLNGDSYSEIDYADFFERGSNVDLLISGNEVLDVSRYGTLDLAEDGEVLKLVEKGRVGPGIINSGVYLVNKEDIEAKVEDVFSFEQDYVQDYTGRFYSYQTDGYFIDIGIPEDYYAACEYFL